MSPFNRIALVGNALASAVSLLNVEGFCAVDTIHKMISQVFFDAPPHQPSILSSTSLLADIQRGLAFVECRTNGEEKGSRTGKRVRSLIGGMGKLAWSASFS